MPALPDDLVDVQALSDTYYSFAPDVSIPSQRVVFGTSGHRGSSLRGSFNENHIAAITQAIVEFRNSQGVTGPLFIGADTHALSRPAQTTAVEVLLGNGVDVRVDEFDDYVPTPAVSRAIVSHNADPSLARTDGIVVTPSHNPPSDGGFKYNPPHGGPSDAETSAWIAERANEIIADGMTAVKRGEASAVGTYDFRSHYVDDLASVIDMNAIREAGVRIGVDPLGGASVHYWSAIAEKYGLDITVMNHAIDPQWAFMPLDWDGKIRMDPSSASVMTFVNEKRDAFDIVLANDADADRFGVVSGDEGLMNPNEVLAVAVDYLLTHRPEWPENVRVGKTVVSSRIIDRVAEQHKRKLHEVPVGFKWFVPGLSEGSLAFGGEESAGGSFLKFDGSTWTTDKDGILLCLLACEIQAVTGSSPAALYRALAEQHGTAHYERVDAPATQRQRDALRTITRRAIKATELAGDTITEIITTAPGNDEPLGGIRVGTQHGWFAARPSGTEDVYKIYAESFRDLDHLTALQDEARAIVDTAIGHG